MKALIAGIFCVMCVAQWYVPLSMISGQESLLRDGAVYLFRTAPVDPADPFRGKYIVLDFEADTFRTASGDWKQGENVFVALATDTKGFATIAGLSRTPPGDSVDFFNAEVWFTSDEIVRIDFPFKRFYMEESKAFEAETVYREGSRGDTTQVAYAVVRVADGAAALEDVRINDRSIVDIVRERNAAKQDDSD